MGQWKKTQCTLCGVSCGLEVEVEGTKVVSVRPDPDSPRSHGYACRKGRNSKYFFDHEDRLNYPMKKVGDHFERISWDQAIDEIGTKLKDIVDEYGPRAVCGIGGASGGGQSELVFLRFLMGALGSQYMFNPIGFEFMGNWWSHGKIFGDQICFTEPDDTGCEVMVLWGSNSYVTHQMGDARKNIREHSENPDQMLIVIDPRMSESARMADLHIANRPGTDALMMKGLIALILQNHWENTEYVNKHVADMDEVRRWFRLTKPEECFRVAGVTMEEMEKLAKILTTKRWGIHQDLGLFCGRHSTLNSYLCLMLEVICGVALVPGATIVHEPWAARGKTINEDDPKIWRGPETGYFPVLQTFPSCIMPVEMLSNRKDRIRAAIRVLGSPMRSYPDSNMVRKAFDNLDLLVVADVTWTEDCEYADYVLPAKSHFERYEFNAFQMNFPEVVCTLRPPIIEETIGERREIPEVLLDIAKKCGAMPELPRWLYEAGEKAARTGDRIPFLMKALAWVAQGNFRFSDTDLLAGVMGETFGRAWGSATKGVAWAAFMVTPMAKDVVKRANAPKLGFHPMLEKMPGMSDFCMLDATFEQVLKHPEGAVVGVARNDEPETYMRQHIKHKDHKIHLYCDTVNAVIGDLNPENEEKALTLTEEFPFLMSSGRHTEDGVNAMMRNPRMNRYHDSYYKLALNPDDLKEMGFEEGQMVNITTKAGSIQAPVTADWQICRGYAMIPHHFGLKFQGVAEGDSTGEITAWDNMDEITGNPCVRYVPCRIEAV